MLVYKKIFYQVSGKILYIYLINNAVQLSEACSNFSHNN